MPAVYLTSRRGSAMREAMCSYHFLEGELPARGTSRAHLIRHYAAALKFIGAFGLVTVRNVDSLTPKRSPRGGLQDSPEANPSLCCPISLFPIFFRICGPKPAVNHNLACRPLPKHSAARRLIDVHQNQLHEFLKGNSVVALNLHGLTKRLPKGYHLQIPNHRKSA